MVVIIVKMPSPDAAGDVAVRRFENQLKIQQLESDALRMRVIDAESSSDRRRHTLEQGSDALTVFLLYCFGFLIHTQHNVVLRPLYTIGQPVLVGTASYEEKDFVEHCFTTVPACPC